MQLVLVAGLIIMGLVNAVSMIWASYLEHKLRQRPAPISYDIHLDSGKLLSEIDLKEANQHAKTVLQKAIDNSAGQVEASVVQGFKDISGDISSMVQTSFSQEFQKYQVSLSELQQQTVEQISNLQTEVDKRKMDLLGELESRVNEERIKHMESFNERINEIVAAYLADTLGYQVDLGAQATYIMQTLEQHKEDIKRDILT